MGQLMIVGAGCIFAGIWILRKRRKYIRESTVYEAEIVSYRSGSAFAYGAPIYTVQFIHNGKTIKKDSDISRYFSPEKLIGKHISIYYNENEKPQRPVRKKGRSAVNVVAISFIIAGVMFLLSAGG